MKIEDVCALVLKIPIEASEVAGMKIYESVVQKPRNIQTDYHFSPPYRTLYSRNIETFLVRIVTDTGIVGYGEAQAPVGPEVIETIVNKLLRPQLIGRNPLDVLVLWQRMYSSMRDRGHTTSFMLDAISAVDIALWDVIGKHLNLPVYQLLGGAHRDKIECYASGLPGSSIEEKIENVNELKRRRFKAIKFSSINPTKDLETAIAVREAVGNEMKIMIDALWLYDVPTAIKLGRELEKYNVYWLEAPIAPEDIDGNVQIACSLSMAVALGEGARTVYQFRELLEKKAADIIQPDVGRAGGITGIKKIATIAESYNIPCAPHWGIGLSVHLAASLQFAAAISNFLIMEYQHTIMSKFANRLLVTPVECKNGCINVSQEPGLGIRINEEAVMDFAV